MPAPDPDSTSQLLPSLPAALLRALLPVAERSELLDDLAAEYGERLTRDGAFRAKAWIWRQALGSCPSLLRRTWWRGWTGFESSANAFRTGGRSVEQWIMDARYAARRLLRRPMYATLAILTLALGVGGTAAIFGIARAVLFNPLPYTDPEGVGLFWMPRDWNQQEFSFLRGNAPGFTELAQFHPRAMTLELGPVRRVMTLVALLTGLALLLGAIGIYGVMSHFVLRRRRDWGIRIALGLRPGRVVSSVVGRGSTLVTFGIGLGLVGFLLLGRLLRPLIYGIGASDPAAIAVAAAVLLLVGVFAAFLPAARAGRTDPAVVFREE